MYNSLTNRFFVYSRDWACPCPGAWQGGLPVLGRGMAGLLSSQPCGFGRGMAGLPLSCPRNLVVLGWQG